MLDEQIMEEAKSYSTFIGSQGKSSFGELYDAFIAGAHSRNEEIYDLKRDIEDLQKMVKMRSDAFECVRKENDRLRNPWISVEDRLPEKTKGVFSCEVKELEKDKIIYYKDERGYIHTGYLNANNHWRDLDRDNTAIYTVTHWMPTNTTN